MIVVLKRNSDKEHVVKLMQHFTDMGLLIEYDLNPSKALKKHQDFSGKICPSTLINSGRWDEFCSAVTAKYKELKADEAEKAS